MLRRMKIPHLVIIQKIDDIPIMGKCSSCSELFEDRSRSSSKADHELTLNKLFAEHLKKAHAGEDLVHSSD
jgi:hypothetical protein